VTAAERAARQPPALPTTQRTLVVYGGTSSAVVPIHGV